MTPTSCTGARWLADAEKNVPDPPSTLSALPNGVSTESSATEPTTRTVMGVVGGEEAAFATLGMTGVVTCAPEP